MTKKTVYGRLLPRITIDPEKGCWVCSGWNTGDGYAKIRVNGKCRVAHRALYEELVGPVPETLLLDHTCKRRSCVNPKHMDPVTPRENTLRGDAVLFKKQPNESPHRV